MVLFKHFRQFYLSRPYLKSILLNLIGKKEESLKLKEFVVLSCDELLKFSWFNFKHHFKLYCNFLKNYSKIKKWVHSQEFNQKYIQKNCPFPPLLNPENLHYQNVLGEVAWDLNLPMPKKAQFILITASFCAHTAMIRGLRKTNLSVMVDHRDIMFEHYAFNYTNMLENNPVAINLTIYGYATNDYYHSLKKALFLLNSQTPVLFLMRDPVSRLKSSLNNRSGFDIKTITENDSLDIFYTKKMRYQTDIHLSLGERIEISVSKGLFKFNEIIEHLKEFNFQNFEFLDIESIQLNNIMQTFSLLSTKYHFNAPQSIEDLKYQWSSYYSGFLPLNYIYKEVEFKLTENKRENLLELTEILSLNKTKLKENIYIYTEEQNKEFVLQHKEDLKEKIETLMLKIKEVSDNEEKNNLITEKDLIEFFKNNPKYIQLLKPIFEKEVELIQQHRPDIVATWKHYLTFQNLCRKQ